MTEQTKHDGVFIRADLVDLLYTIRMNEDDVEYIRADIVSEQLAERDAEIASFCMDYRIKCDEDTKRLEKQLAAKDALLRQAKNALEITHELYANASSGYGFARPENPHNFHCDIDCCSKEEIAAHSKACDDYAAGRKVTNESWGIGTYCDEYAPALEAIAAIDKELGK